ncbi:MAG: SNF2-related protein [Verrucomicrobiota bacterium]
MKATRSTTAPENLQEILDAEETAKWATLGGQQQYITPEWLADQCDARLAQSTGVRQPASILDPQCGTGALICGHGYSTARYGIDIDARAREFKRHVHLLTGNCVKVMDAIDELFPELRWVVINANPPFGKRWKRGHEVVDSTEYTWQWVLRHGCLGYFIGNDATLKRLGIDTHPWVFHYETHEGRALWKGVEIQIGIAFWQHPDRPEHTRVYGDTDSLNAAWDTLKKVLDEEAFARPPFNIYLDQGLLRTYLSTRTTAKFKLTREQILRLHRLNGCHPLTLTTEKETRILLRELVDCGFYTIQPEAKAAIESALEETNRLACPILPVTDFEAVAYADEEDHLVCHTNWDEQGMRFTVGVKYKLTTNTYKFSQSFKRKKVHFDETTCRTYTADHSCTLSGQDRYIALTDDSDNTFWFMDRPDPQQAHQRDESLLWKIFHKPEVRTLGETAAELIRRNVATLRTCELMAGFTYYPGQLDYLARVGVKDRALIGADVGTGKTLFAISMLALKGPTRALIIAPQGTMRSSEEDDEAEEYNASQWIAELNRFAPYLQVFELFTPEDYQRICALNDGTLPPGVYVSYYQAMFQNGARETAAASWDDARFARYMEQNFGLKAEWLPPATDERNDREWTDTVGHEKNGIRCIIAPCLATRIGRHFDMVLLDEAHLVSNLEANVSQMLIRMQPKYRYAFTATPIPNLVSNLFSLMGWLCVEDWYQGDRRNTAWPYARHELGRFNDTFLSEERDFTEEDRKRAADPTWRGKCTKTSPVISSPARLLKLLKPTMAYISKLECNPEYKESQVIDVRVPMGKEQAKLYGHCLHRGNIPASNALVRARKQIAWLRNICADPAGFMKGGNDVPRVSSNLNPKTVAILELVREILEREEQVVIVCSRLGQTNTLQHRLVDAGVPLARIDSTISPSQHAQQANWFKRGRARVQLMGIKCAMGYSFPDCPNLIIGSLEYSFGPFHQAKGRIDRVNSRWPRRIYCILHQQSIEETMFDAVAAKEDAATICLKGRRVPRDFQPVEIGELLAKSITAFTGERATSEAECELRWPALRAAIRAAM